MSEKDPTDIFHMRRPLVPPLALSLTPAVSSEGTPGLACQLHQQFHLYALQPPTKLTPSFKDRLAKYLTREGFCSSAIVGLRATLMSTPAHMNYSR